MSLTLYFHPLSSFCQKVLVALYENATPFTPHMVNLGDAREAGEFRQIWPIGKFPVLKDDTRDRLVPESSIIIEYLAQHYPGRIDLVFDDADLARQTRLKDRFYDFYVQQPMQKIVGDRLRPVDQRDAFGVEQARGQLLTAYDLIEKDMADKHWAMGEAFSMADCAAAPALYYANLVAPFAGTHPNTARYFDRLLARPSFARAVSEAEPYRGMFPKG